MSDKDMLARLGLSGLGLSGDDKDRELAIHSNEKLFNAWQASRQPIATWIESNRALIDETAGRRAPDGMG
jgi:hypothetical protein